MHTYLGTPSMQGPNCPHSPLLKHGAKVPPHSARTVLRYYGGLVTRVSEAQFQVPGRASPMDKGVWAGACASCTKHSSIQLNSTANQESVEGCKQLACTPKKREKTNQCMLQTFSVCLLVQGIQASSFSGGNGLLRFLRATSIGPTSQQQVRKAWTQHCINSEHKHAHMHTLTSACLLPLGIRNYKKASTCTHWQARVCSHWHEYKSRYWDWSALISDCRTYGSEDWVS